MTGGSIATTLAVLASVLPLVACAGEPAAAPPGTPAATVRVVTQSNVFRPSELTVPANAPFEIALENRDAVPHNLAIDGPQKMASDVFTGPAERTNRFAPLPAGAYGFICEVHPEMRGTLVSR